jgi:hypothetical protein
MAGSKGSLASGLSPLAREATLGRRRLQWTVAAL